MKTENNDINEITYLILQHLYLEKQGIDSKDIKQITEIFPPRWSSLNYKTKIKIISYALKNNCSLEKSFEENHSKKMNSQKNNSQTEEQS